jgi:hypothetical protein
MGGQKQQKHYYSAARRRANMQKPHCTEQDPYITYNEVVYSGLEYSLLYKEILLYRKASQLSANKMHLLA